MITRLTGAALVCSSLTIFRARADTTNLPIGFCTDDFAAAKAAGFDFAIWNAMNPASRLAHDEIGLTKPARFKTGIQPRLAGASADLKMIL
jgi:hypothetical protein